MSTHHGFIKEFPFIRVDAFDGDAQRVNPYSDHAPHFFLLTHAHTDHFVGLDSKTFEGEIYCTAVTKHLLLNTMEAGERVRYAELPGTGKKRKFANLWSRRGAMGASRRGAGRGGRDMIKVLEINKPTKIDGPQGSVVVTALDANHCPGSCMFLIEGLVRNVQRSVIVTGDIRAEPDWVDALQRNPLVAKYIRWPRELLMDEASVRRREKGKGKEEDRWPTLDCIYLDTSAVMLDEELMGKKEAVSELVGFMAAYPPDTKFFINSWTWGYEEILKGVALAFNTTIHFDWYKTKMYASDPILHTDPLLASLGSATPTSHRFHACERRWKCDEVWGDGRGCYEFAEKHLASLEGPKRLKRPGSGEGEGGARVVYVNPCEMTRKRWEEYRAKVEERFEKVAWKEGGREGVGEEALPDYLIVPLSRHSSLPELKAFVSIFKPRTLYPLTIAEDSRRPCRDYLSLSTNFASCLAPGGAKQLAEEASTYTKALVASRASTRHSPLDASTRDIGENNLGWFSAGTPTAVLAQNIEGGHEIAKLVEAWARPALPAPPLTPERERARSPKRARREDGPSPHATSSSFSPPAKKRLTGVGNLRRAPSSPVRSPGQQHAILRRLATSPSLSPKMILVPATLSAPNLPQQFPLRKLLDSAAIIHPPRPRAVGTDVTALSANQLPPPVASTSEPAPRLAPSAMKKTGSGDGSSLDLPNSLGGGRVEKCVTFLSPLRSTPASSAASTPTATTPMGFGGGSPDLFVPATPSGNAPALLGSVQGGDEENSSTAAGMVVSSPQTKGGGKTYTITARPALETRDRRREVMASLMRKMGGRLGPGGVVVPLAPGDPFYEVTRKEGGAKDVAEGSFSTVDESGSEKRGK